MKYSISVATLVLLVLLGAASGAALTSMVSSSSSSGGTFSIDAPEVYGINQFTLFEVDDGDINLPKNRIWFMPCCGSRSEHVEKATAVAEYAKAMNVNFSPRLHLLIWDMALKV